MIMMTDSRLASANSRGHLGVPEAEMAEPEPEQQDGLGTEGLSSNMLHHMVIQALDDAEERLPTVLRGERSRRDSV